MIPLRERIQKVIDARGMGYHDVEEPEGLLTIADARDCPFCGGETELVRHFSCGHEDWQHIECCGCRVSMPRSPSCVWIQFIGTIYHKADTTDKLVRAWNG